MPSGVSSKSRGDVLPLFLYLGDFTVREIGIFADESGGQGGHSRYYVLTLVFHEQDKDISAELEKHRRGLADRHLKELPFHAGPLMNGHDEYEGMDFAVRKAYFSHFFLLLQHLPITYHTFVYKRSEFSGVEGLTSRMRRDITNLLFDNLDYIQSFDKVKIYYDDGQEMVAKALHAAVEYVISTQSILYRRSSSADFALAQTADMLCALELAAVKFSAGEQTRTDEKMFGCARAFKNNYMKVIKRKRLMR